MCTTEQKNAFRNSSILQGSVKYCSPSQLLSASPNECLRMWNPQLSADCSYLTNVCWVRGNMTRKLLTPQYLSGLWRGISLEIFFFFLLLVVGTGWPIGDNVRGKIALDTSHFVGISPNLQKLWPDNLVLQFLPMIHSQISFVKMLGKQIFPAH